MVFRMQRGQGAPAPYLNTSNDSRNAEGAELKVRDDGADLEEFIWILRRNARIIGAATLLALVIGGAYCLLATRKYTASTSIFFDSIPHAPVGTDPAATVPAVADPLLVESQLKVISSDAVLRRVVIAQNLTQDIDYVPKIPGIIAQIKAMFVDPGVQRSPIDVAVTALGRDVEATRSDKTYVIDLSVSATSAGKAVRLANAVSAAYLEDQQEATNGKVARDTSWLNQRIAELQSQRSLAEKKVAAFRASHRINDANGKNVAEQELGDLATQLVQARAATTAARARAAQIHKVIASGRRPDATADAIGSTALDRLNDQNATLARQEADLRQTLGDRHPALQAVLAQERGVQTQIARELSRIAESADNNLQVAQATEQDTEQRLEAERKTDIDQSQALLELADLQHNADDARALYEQFVQTREKILGAVAAAQSARIIAPASEPTAPSSPKVPLVLAISLLSGLFFGAAGALAKEALNHRDPKGEDEEPPAPKPTARLFAVAPIRPSAGPTEANKPTAQRAIVIPPIDTASETGLLQKIGVFSASARATESAQKGPPSASLDAAERLPNSAYARAIEQAWGAVAPVKAQREPGRPWSILVTSLSKRSGKTTVAANLAREAAKSGARVLLIETNAGAPGLSDMITENAEPGIIDIWKGQRIFYQTTTSNGGTLDFVPCMPSESLMVQRVAARSSTKIQSLFDYDVAIVDSETDHTDAIYEIIADADRIALITQKAAADDVDRFVSIFGVLFRHKTEAELVLLEDGRAKS